MNDGRVTTLIRVRPISDSDKCVLRQSDSGRVLVSTPENTKELSFDCTVWPDGTNTDVYDMIVGPRIAGFLEGYHTSFLAYGPTASGKSHTVLGAPADPGLVFRAAQELIDSVPAASTLTVAFYEVYNSKIYDLLPEKPVVRTLNFVLGEDRLPVIDKLTRHPVTDITDVTARITRAQERRTTSATGANRRSSRSHAIIQFQLSYEAPDGMAVTSALTFVDLAGSERLAQTRAEGKRKEEGASINSSLLVLGCVVRALRQGKPQQMVDVICRDSVLTRVLAGQIGGNARTTFVCCVNPHIDHYKTTLATLTFASDTMGVPVRAQRNESARSEPVLVRKLQAEVAALRAQLATFQDLSAPRHAPARAGLYTSDIDAALAEHGSITESEFADSLARSIDCPLHARSTPRAGAARPLPALLPATPVAAPAAVPPTPFAQSVFLDFDLPSPPPAPVAAPALGRSEAAVSAAPVTVSEGVQTLADGDAVALQSVLAGTQRDLVAAREEVAALRATATADRARIGQLEATYAPTVERWQQEVAEMQAVAAAQLAQMKQRMVENAREKLQTAMAEYRQRCNEALLKRVQALGKNGATEESTQ